MTAARVRLGPASGGDAGRRAGLGLAVSVLLHAAVLGGLLWWVARDIPAEIPEQGVELMWDQPNQAALAAGPEGDTATPEAPPSVPPPPAPEAEAEPQPPEEAPPPPPSPSIAEATQPPLATAPAPPAPAMAAAPLPQPAPLPPPPPPALPDGVLPPQPPPLPEPPRQEARPPEPPPPEPQRDVAPQAQPSREPLRAAPAPPQPRPEPAARPPRPATPRPAAPSPQATQPGPPQPAQAPPGQAAGASLALGATSAPSLDPGCANPPPVYPPNSRRAGEEGVVQIVVTIGANGRAIGAQIAASSRSAALDEAARRAVLGWCYRPALRNGEAVQGQVATNIRFTLQ